ncbi:unnamed protein product [Nezara viridula]|uniref:Uncharacterized protein n=1 Tax=Nezara viridula TaxID=85310 RepID=A0A9P0DW39_NEZVI|nr:unnamed protein product [Nezara viridula]
MAPTDNTSSDSGTDMFELKCTLSVNNLFPVHKYVSVKTGITVVVAEVEGPVVDGYFCLATEAHDDDGLPHTLEHLIFLGSELYPYKGVLDLLANRCFASGTNAWTDTDHTCYTITTAGAEGFIALMPIYLDHILFPTLNDAAFTTEVYHVNGEGRDGGVVFTEMQGVENTGERKVNRELTRAMYPGDCGYKSVTGGTMHNLRTSTTNEKVRDYHKKFYRPENLYLIIVGNIKPSQILDALKPFEERILSKGTRQDAFIRPWQTPVLPLTSSIDINVPYPNDEEDIGLVYMGWRGPSAVNDFYRMTACSILLKYLTDTTVSPLPKEFVDVPDPYASKVWFSMSENSESLLLLNFDNVPIGKIHQVKPKLDSVLSSILNSEKPIDMKRLSTVINRYKLEILSNLENSPHDCIAFMVIGYVLYGNTPEDLDDRLNQVKLIEKLLTEPMEFWTGLLRTYLVEGHCVTAKGIPSIKEQIAMKEEDEYIFEILVKHLGPEGLKKKGEELAAAMAINEIPPPEGMLCSVPISSIDSIHFHTISSTTSDSKVQDSRFNLSNVPVFMQLDHLQTNFVYIIALLDSSSVDDKLRPYLPLLLDLLQESPVKRGNNIIPYQEIVSQLEEDTIATVFRVGLDSSSRFQAGPFSSTISVVLQVEPKKFEQGIKWIQELLYNTVLTEERVKVLATKIVNNVSEIKRKGNAMAYDLMRGLLYGKRSNHHAISALRQTRVLSSVILKLQKEDTASEVMNDLENLRSILTLPSNMVIHMSANLDILSSLYQNPPRLLNNLLPANVDPVKGRLRAVPDWKLLQERDVKDSCVAGMGSVESAFFVQTVPGISDFNDADLPKILVFFQYISQTEGPLWRTLRGQGLAYHYSLMARPNESKLFLYFYRASNVIAAYKEARNVIEGRLGKNVIWEKTLFESAKSSLIFEIVHREKCIGDVVGQSLLSYFKNVGHDYNRNLIKQISNVKEADMEKIGSKYIAPLLDMSLVKTTAVCHTSKVYEITNGLNQLGLHLNSFANLDQSFLNDE